MRKLNHLRWPTKGLYGSALHLSWVSKMLNDSLAEMIDPARRAYFNICFNGKHQLDSCCVWDMGNNRCSCTLTCKLLFVTPTNTTKNWQGGYLWMFVPNPNYCSWEDRRHVQELLHEFWTVVGLQAFRNKSNISDLFQHVLWSTENICIYIYYCIYVYVYEMNNRQIGGLFNIFRSK